MTQPRIDFDAAPEPPSSLTTSPSAIQARRSGRQRVVSTIHARMARYRNWLQYAGPKTDHEMASQFFMGAELSVINAIRGEWKSWAEHHGVPNPVQPHSRVRQDWGNGKPTTRVRWHWVEGR